MANSATLPSQTHPILHCHPQNSHLQLATTLRSYKRLSPLILTSKLLILTSLPYHQVHHSSKSQQTPPFLFHPSQPSSTLLHQQQQLPQSSSMPKQSLSTTRLRAIYPKFPNQHKKLSESTTITVHHSSVLVPRTQRIQLCHPATYQSCILVTIHFPVCDDVHADAKACWHENLTGTATSTTEISVELQEWMPSVH